MRAACAHYSARFRRMHGRTVCRVLVVLHGLGVTGRLARVWLHERSIACHHKSVIKYRPSILANFTTRGECEPIPSRDFDQRSPISGWHRSRWGQPLCLAHFGDNLKLKSALFYSVHVVVDLPVLDRAINKGFTSVVAVLDK